MILPRDYDTAIPFSGKGNYQALPIGGHVCKIIGAREMQNKDGAEMIEIAFDIAEGGEYDGFYKSKFDARRKERPEAKWPNDGLFRQFVSRRDGSTNSYFKGLITSIEKSNPPFNFKATGPDVKSLNGKMVGFNFGEDEYRGTDGKMHTVVKAFYAVSIDRVRAGIEPPQKRVARGSGNSSMEDQGFVEVDNEPLPF